MLTFFVDFFFSYSFFAAKPLFSSTAYGLDFSVCPSERYREFGWLSVSNQAENWILASFLDEFRLGTNVKQDPREVGWIFDSVHATAENSLYGLQDYGSGVSWFVLARFWAGGECGRVDIMRMHADTACVEWISDQFTTGVRILYIRSGTWSNCDQELIMRNQ